MFFSVFACYVTLIHVAESFKRPIVRTRLSVSPTNRLSSSAQADDSLEPTRYVDNLYDALGVPMTANRTQLRDAYWAIASKAHPDRDKSIDALYQFRNASHAYAVLGRDEKTRSEYDSKLKTKMYVDMIGDVSNDVLRPLAMDVALPLLNFTMHSIGSVAIPFMKDMFEQSSVAFQAAFEPAAPDTTLLPADTSPEWVQVYKIMASAPENVFHRAGQAIEKTQFEQTIRKIETDLENNHKKFDEALIELDRMVVEERRLESTLMGLESNKTFALSELDECKLLEEKANQYLLSAKSIEGQAIREYEATHTAIKELTRLSIDNAAAVSSIDEEIADLEARLVAAREKRTQLATDRANIAASLQRQNSMNEGLIERRNTATRSAAELQQGMADIKETRMRNEGLNLKITDSVLAVQREVNKIKQSKESVNSKIQRLDQKSIELYAAKADLQEKWDAKMQAQIAANNKKMTQLYNALRERNAREGERYTAGFQTVPSPAANVASTLPAASSYIEDSAHSIHPAGNEQKQRADQAAPSEDILGGSEGAGQGGSLRGTTARSASARSSSALEMSVSHPSKLGEHPTAGYHEIDHFRSTTTTTRAAEEEKEGEIGRTIHLRASVSSGGVTSITSSSVTSSTAFTAGSADSRAESALRGDDISTVEETWDNMRRRVMVTSLENDLLSYEPSSGSFLQTAPARDGLPPVEASVDSSDYCDERRYAQPHQLEGAGEGYIKAGSTRSFAGDADDGDRSNSADSAGNEYTADRPVDDLFDDEPAEGGEGMRTGSSPDTSQRAAAAAVAAGGSPQRNRWNPFFGKLRRSETNQSSQQQETSH